MTASYSMNTRSPSSAARPLAAVLAFSASAFACRARSSLSVFCAAPHCGTHCGSSGSPSSVAYLVTSSSSNLTSSSPRRDCSTADGCHFVCQGGGSRWPATAEGWRRVDPLPATATAEGLLLWGSC